MISVVQTEPRRSTVSLIMLGEDARAIQSSVSQYGIIATLYPNIKQASEALGTWQYQAVLCDLKMLGAGQFVRSYRAKFPRIPFLVFTRPRDLRRGILATLNGASGYIQTPLEPKIVASIVVRTLEAKRLASALQRFPISS